MKRISEISHLDNTIKNLGSKERHKQRMIVAKPKADDFFAWAKPRLKNSLTNPKAAKDCSTSSTRRLSFASVFLPDGDVPMNINPSEQAIRPFTLVHKNRINADTVRGAEANAIMYSLVTELPKHADDTSRNFLAHLLLWYEFIQEGCVTGKIRLKCQCADLLEYADSMFFYVVLVNESLHFNPLSGLKRLFN